MNPHDRYLYDSKTGLFTWALSPGGRVKKGDKAGCVSGRGYLYVRLNGVNVLAHRLAWFMVYGRWPDSHIDHINGIKTDNRIENLRELNNSENLHCQHNIKRNNTSGITGVHFNKREKKFVASIQVDGKARHLGYFTDTELAKTAYLNAKKDAFPELFCETEKGN